MLHGGWRAGRSFHDSDSIASGGTFGDSTAGIGARAERCSQPVDLAGTTMAIAA
jgi:hypothetical protein